jgi:hypothetical protein
VGATKRTVNARLKDQKGYSYREYDEQLMPARTRAQAEKSGSKLSMPKASAQIQIKYSRNMGSRIFCNGCDPAHRLRLKRPTPVAGLHAQR